MHRYWAIPCLLVVACGPGIEEDVASDSQSLNGTLTTSGCSQAEVQKLQAAMAHILQQTSGFGMFHDCIRDAMMLLDLDKTPEAIERALRQNLPTHVTCVDDGACSQQGVPGNACTQVGTPDERIKVLHSFIQANSTTVEILGGTIAHEVMHNKGFTHPIPAGNPEFSFTVPEQVQSCIGAEFQPIGEPGFLARSSLPRETELPHIGGGGGFPFELACGSCDFALGLNVDSSESFVNRISMICDTSTTQSVGTFNDSVVRAPRQCSADEVLIGFVSGSGAMVNGLVGLCARRDVVRAGRTDVSRVLDYGGSTAAEDETTRLCPPHMGVKRIYGRAGGRIDQMRLVCESLDAPPQGVPHGLAVVGTASGPTRRYQCLGNGVMTGLWGSNDTEVRSLGGSCLATMPGSNGGVVVDPSFDFFHLLPSVGGRQSVHFSSNCPDLFDGDAMVGIRVRAGARLDQIQGICANATAWANESASVTRKFTALQGGNGGFPSTLECPRGEFLVGLQTFGATVTVAGAPVETVGGVQPICRRLDYPRPNLPPTVCGGGVGTVLGL